MRTLRPVRETTEDSSENRLSFDAPGPEGRRLRISIEPPTIGDSTALPPGDAARAAGLVAIRAFRLAGMPRPLVFTLAIGLSPSLPGPPPGPEALPGVEAEPAELAVGSGTRISRTVAGPSLGDGTNPPVLCVEYLVRTPCGALALTFSTPHTGGREEFTLLFDQIARSCAIEPAQATHAG